MMNRRRASGIVGTVGLLLSALVMGCPGGGSITGGGSGGASGSANGNTNGNANGNTSGNTNGNTSGVVDPELLALKVLVLAPPAATVLSGSSLQLSVQDPQERDLTWEFELVDPVGDQGDLGSIRLTTEEPPIATYTAPTTNKAITVEIIVRNPDQEEETASAGVTVLPVDGEFLVTPVNPKLGLNNSLQFSAIHEVLDTVTTLQNVHWRINGVSATSAAFGDIDRLGRYFAPNSLPPAASSPTVGYALTPEGPEVATVNVLLAELILDQKEFHATQAGAAGKITGRINYSDGTSKNVSGNVLDYVSDFPPAAGVAVDGTVQIGNMLGRAVIKVIDKESGAYAFAQAFSRSDIKLVAEVERQTDTVARIDRTDEGGTTFIEFTRPDPIFHVIPRVTVLRGERAGTEYAGINENISFKVDGSIGDYDSSKLVHEPNPSGFAATFDVSSGKVRIGSKPGNGTITIIYDDITFDDDLVRHEVTLTVQFSRLEIQVTAQSAKTAQTDTAFLTEHMDVTVQLINPSSNSDFIGRTPLEVTLGDEGETMRIFYGIEIMSSNSDHNFRRNWSNETDKFTLRVPSSLIPNGGQSRFAIDPQRSGAHTIRITSLHDEEVVPAELNFTVIKPKLKANYKDGIEQPVPAGSFVEIVQDPDEALQGVGLMSQYLEEGTYHTAFNDMPIWTVSYKAPLSTDPPVVTELPLDVEGFTYFGMNFEKPGTYSIKLGFKEHPEFETEELEIAVFDQDDIFYDTTAVVDPFGKSIPKSNQCGALQLKEPFQNAWAPNAPLQIVIQTYSAEGVAQTVGHTQRTVRITNGNADTTETDFVVGIQIERVSGPFFLVEGDRFPTGSTGEIVFNIKPAPSDEKDASDMVLRIWAAVFQFAGDSYTGPLPVQTLTYVDGAGPLVDGQSSSVAVFVDTKDKISLDHYIMISGRGLSISPRQITVPTQRLRDAVAQQLHPDLPAGSDQATFRVTGSASFQTDLASGLSSADLGAGMSLESSSKDGQFLSLTVSTEAGVELGQRDIVLTFNNGKTWKGTLDLFDNKFFLGTQHSDKNLALNARHHDAHPPGSQVLIVQSPSFTTVPTLEAKLHPSLKPGDTFRGAETSNLLVGFRRERLSNGAYRVTEDTIKFHQKDNPDILIVGDITDRRKLDLQAKTLSATGQPDFLPDFVSKKKDGELLTLELAGNLCDCLLFAAYNVMAEPKGDLPDPQLGFDGLKGDIGNAYGKYASTEGQTAREAAEAETAQSIKVFVDHEAGGFSLDFDKNRVKDPVFTAYYAGLLDQYYLWDGRTSPSLLIEMLGQDGRVRAFNGDRNERMLVTGVTRRTFGLELDSVIYDPSLFGIDASVNAESLRGIPVVFAALNADTDLTAQGLVAEQGGSSGGYFDLDVKHLGSYFVVAKTPGQEFPGLDVGYLIRGKPKDLTDPWTGTVENDISDVLIKRTQPADGSSAAGTKIVGENTTRFGFKNSAPRRVLGLNSQQDFKEPIETAIREKMDFKVVSDPPGVDGVRIRTAILIREKPLQPKDLINLVVTTRSSGNEAVYKGLLDAVIGFIADMTKSVVLTFATSGYCGGELGAETLGNLTTALINAGVGSINNSYIEPYIGSDKAESLDMVNGLLHDGHSIVPSIDSGIQVSATDIVNSDMFYEEIDNWRKGFSPKRMKLPGASVIAGAIPKLGLCALLGSPFENLKDAVKDSFSTEDLGGNGSAVAIGSTSLAMAIQASDRLAETGTYSVVTTLTRRLDIVPGEENFKNLKTDFPGFYEDAAHKSDVDLLENVAGKLGDESLGDTARKLLIKMAVNSVYRDTDSGTYEEYRVRYAKRLPLQMLVIPGSTLNNFEFKTNESEFPVVWAATVSAVRSNQNATARAMIRSEGFDVILIHAVVAEKKDE